MPTANTLPLGRARVAEPTRATWQDTGHFDGFSQHLGRPSRGDRALRADTCLPVLTWGPAPVSFTSVPQGRCPDPFQGGLKAKQITERAEPPPRWEEAGLRVGAGLGGPGRPAGCGQLSAASGLGLAGQSRGDNRTQQRRRLESRAATRWRHGPRKAGPARPDPARPGPALEPRGPGRRCRVPGASGRQEGGRRGRSVTVAPGACWAVLGGNGKRWSGRRWAGTRVALVTSSATSGHARLLRSLVSSSGTRLWW